jgi:hypothetical protein
MEGGRKYWFIKIRRKVSKRENVREAPSSSSSNPQFSILSENEFPRERALGWV